MADDNKTKSSSRAAKAEVQGPDADKPVLIKETTIEHEGVEYAFRQDAFDDIEILEELEDERYISVMRKILGKKKWVEFKESVRTESGRVPTGEFETFLEKVMGAVGPTDAS